MFETISRTLRRLQLAIARPLLEEQCLYFNEERDRIIQQAREEVTAARAIFQEQVNAAKEHLQKQLAGAQDMLKAIGEKNGRESLLYELEDNISARRGREVNYEDLEWAKRKGLH